jgi:pimeloyl-ACP methyl ester carboxylesterase
VSAAQIPLTSLPADIAATERLLALQTGPTVLVGHSYGGAVISGVANNMPGVQALVYIAATAVDEGESLDSLSKLGTPAAGADAVRAGASGYLWIERRDFHKSFAADVEPTEAAVLAAVQKPLSTVSYTSKAGPPTWKRLPSWYLMATADQMIPPSAQEFMAKRMGVTLSSVAASHALIVSRPKEVAAIILVAARTLA